MSKHTEWFPLPDLYRTFENPEILKRFAKAYMAHNFPAWKPIKINNYRVLAKRVGDENGLVQ
ncbi:hypothetical protein ACTID9_00855 [Brevibacillus fluminis]|uniref:hypothetical protein n=1 Tax=Brevibacillus fluminis TaxID=511487 RepID=UPI003F8C1416